MMRRWDGWGALRRPWSWGGILWHRSFISVNEGHHPFNFTVIWRPYGFVYVYLLGLRFHAVLWPPKE